jgi:chromosome segregation ATPase
MFMEAPQTLLYVAAGAFLLGWLVAKFGSWLGGKSSSNKRDPRDDRIRSLEAEHRVAKNDSDKSREELGVVKKDLDGTAKTVVEKDQALIKQHEIIVTLRKDLKESVKKTRELRAELTERATESIKSEVKLREVETELSVAQASTDLIATGVLDYSMAPDGEEDGDKTEAKAGS